MKNKLNLPNKIHFIGIGGAGMNPLAGICLKAGVKVTGSDSTQNKNQDELRALGADIWTPHSAEELAKRELPDICVYSTAIPDNNPEVIYLKEKGVQFWHRSDLLEKIANNFEKQIVIAGTHGKTTTTAMLVWILEKAGLKPCWVLGGVLKGLGSYGWSEQREIFVFEGDESDQSFLKSKPYIGLVTSLEPDHLENYNNSFEEQIKKFGEFADKCETFICHENIQKYFSINNLQTYKYSNLLKGKLKIIGEHNYLNALGALSVIDNLEIDLYKKKNPRNKSEVTFVMPDALPESSPQANDLNDSSLDFNSHYTSENTNENTKTFFEQAINYLKDFSGIYRRFEIIGTTPNNITVIDDYAHHPTEVKTAIQAGKEFLKQKDEAPPLGGLGGKGKLIVCFQPHLPTRLRDLWKEFTECFEEADQLFLADLYVARGQPIEGINSENLFKEIKHHNKVHILGQAENLIKPVIESTKANDLILILGAGDITYIRENLLNNLNNNNESIK